MNIEKNENIETVNNDINSENTISKYSDHTMELIKDWRHMYSKCPAIRKKWQKQIKDSLRKDRLNRSDEGFILENLNEQ